MGGKVIVRELGCLGLLFLLLLCPGGSEGNVDCRKFVYAPKCRGVHAKRAITPPRALQPQDILTSLLQAKDNQALLNRLSKMNEINEDARTYNEGDISRDISIEDLTSPQENADYQGQEEGSRVQIPRGKNDLSTSLIRELNSMWVKVKAAVDKTNEQQIKLSHILQALRGQLQANYDVPRQNS